MTRVLNTRPNSHLTPKSPRYFQHSSPTLPLLTFSSTHKVEIAPPLLGKFQALLLNNRDLEGLARCLPSDLGNTSPGVVVGSGSLASDRRWPKGDGTVALAAAAGAGIDGRSPRSGGCPGGSPGSPGARSMFSSDSNTTMAEEEVLSICVFVCVCACFVSRRSLVCLYAL